MGDNRVRVSALVLLVSMIFVPPAKSQELAHQNGTVLRDRLTKIASSFPGKVGIFVRNIETGEEAGLNPDDQFPMASTYKVAIMAQVFREAEAGHLSLTERVPLSEADRRLGSGLLPYVTPGLNPTIHDLVLLMITLSDNEATDMLMKRVGAKNVTAMLRQLGIQDMRVDRSTEELIGDWLTSANPSLREVSGAEFFAHPEKLAGLTRDQTEHADRAFVDDPRDHTSPKAMADLLTKIFRAQAASEKSCHDMLEIMEQQQLRTRIHRYLENATVASKNGTIGYVTNDVGIVSANKHHFVVSVYTLKANSNVTTEQAEELIGRIARATYNYFEDAGR
jgi:beta-lactamase class A